MPALRRNQATENTPVGVAYYGGSIRQAVDCLFQKPLFADRLLAVHRPQISRIASPVYTSWATRTRSSGQ